MLSFVCRVVAGCSGVRGSFGAGKLTLKWIMRVMRSPQDWGGAGLSIANPLTEREPEWRRRVSPERGPGSSPKGLRSLLASCSAVSRSFGLLSHGSLVPEGTGELGWAVRASRARLQCAPPRRPRVCSVAGGGVRRVLWRCGGVRQGLWRCGHGWPEAGSSDKGCYCPSSTTPRTAGIVWASDSLFPSAPTCGCWHWTESHSPVLSPPASAVLKVGWSIC